MTEAYYLINLAERLSAYRGRTVPQDLVDEWRGLPVERREEVRGLLRNGIHAAPVTTQREDVRPPRERRSPKLDGVIEYLKIHGKATSKEIADYIKSTRSSTTTMIGHINKKGQYRIIKQDSEEGYLYSLANTELFEQISDDKPLSRGERGAIGARSSRGGSKRSPGVFDDAAIAALEEAGAAGLSIDEWAKKMRVTPGGMYRRITTLRRKGWNIETSPRDKQNEKGRYIWRGEPSGQMELPTHAEEVTPAPSPRMMTIRDIAQLFDVPVEEMTHNVPLDWISVLPWYREQGGRRVWGVWLEDEIEPIWERFVQSGKDFRTFMSEARCELSPELQLPNGTENKADTDVVTATKATDVPQSTSEDLRKLILDTMRCALQERFADESKDIAQSLDYISQRLTSVEEKLARVQTQATGRYPVIDALRSLELYMQPGFDPRSMLQHLMDESDPVSVRDWISKLHGKVRWLKSVASDLAR